MSEEISKADLKKEIQEILKDADLDNTSAKKVRLQLQEKLDVDLTDRKKEVDQLVMEVIDEQTQDDGEEEEDEDEEDDEDEEEAPPPKKKAASKPKKRAPSVSGSDDDGSEDEVPSDGGGSDYEPDEPVKINKRKSGGTKKAKYGSDDESSGEEWGGSKKSKSKGGRKKKSQDSDDSDYEKPKKKRKSNPGGKNGYTAPVKLSAELADIVGGEEMPRHEVVKRMWAYIKENQLQDPKNKQMIKCDDKLSKVIPTKKFRGFGMTKFLKDHMNVE